MPHKLYPFSAIQVVFFLNSANPSLPEPALRSNLHSPAGNVIPREKCRSDVVITIVRTAKKTRTIVSLARRGGKVRSIQLSDSRLVSSSFHPRESSYELRRSRLPFDRLIFHFSFGAFKSLITSHEHRLYILILPLLLLPVDKTINL